MNGVEPTIGELVELVTIEEPHRIASGILESTEDEAFRLRVTEASLGSGTRVRAQRGVRDDARYTIAGLVIDSGPPLLQVRTTGNWKRVQQREFVRLRLRAQVWASLAPASAQAARASAPPPEMEEISGLVIDVSAGGAQIETPVALTENTCIMVRFELPEGGMVQSQGMVVRTHPARDGNHLNGIQFLGLPGNQETMIQRFIYQQQLEARRNTLM